LNFYGLQATNGALPVSWQHFRPPVTPEARKVMEDDMAVFTTNFFDTIEQDKPKGSWGLQIDSKIKNVTVRSFLWPGYFAFHRMSTELFGSAYIGDGSKNIDLPFMI
jgi:radial spoke head protein 9